MVPARDTYSTLAPENTAQKKKELHAKEDLKRFVSKVDKKLEVFWDSELNKHFGFNSKQAKLVTFMLEHAKEHNLRTAKRIRGAFVYYGYLLGNTLDERIWNPVMSVELVHTALLMHDDVMDLDEVRRGKPTTQKVFEQGDPHYGESMAYTIGDVVLSMGYQLLAESTYEIERVNQATVQLLRGIVNTGFGQAYDITLEKLKNEWVEDDVISLHKAKTAIYTYENPLLIGAILSGLKGKVFEVLHDYSMDGGVCFQLQDDILGVYGDPEKTGKSADSDLLQGKGTLLVQKTFELGNTKQKAALEKVWGKRKANRQNIEEAKQAIKDSGSFEYSNKISREFAWKAVNTAEKLRDLKLNDKAIDFIQGIAQYMLDRDL